MNLVIKIPHFFDSFNGLRSQSMALGGVDSVWEQEKPEASLPKVALVQEKILASDWVSERHTNAVRPA
jgi:hypothetical protein